MKNFTRSILLTLSILAGLNLSAENIDTSITATQSIEEQEIRSAIVGAIQILEEAKEANDSDAISLQKLKVKDLEKQLIDLDPTAWKKLKHFAKYHKLAIGTTVSVAAIIIIAYLLRNRIKGFYNNHKYEINKTPAQSTRSRRKKKDSELLQLGDRKGEITTQGSNRKVVKKTKNK